MPRLKRRSVAPKSTGGRLTPIPAPVDPVGNALTSNTVAPLRAYPDRSSLTPRSLRSWTRSGRDDKRAVNPQD